MTTSRLRWWPVSGIVFVVAFLVAVVLIGNPGQTDEELRAWHEEHRVRQIVAFFLFAGSAVAYLWFVATVRAVLASAEPEPRPLSGLGFAGGVTTAVLVVVGAAPVAGLSDIADDTETGLAAVASLTYPVLTIGIGASSLLALAAGLLVLRSRILPRWFGWASVAAAPLILVAVLFVPIFIFLGWVLATSIVLLTQRAPQGPG